MNIRVSKGFVTFAAVALIAFLPIASANAASLRQGSTALGNEVTGALPGEVLWGFYETFESELGNGDNILRLINPNGGANSNLAGAKTQTVCAMIYVFDQDQEMGECCGCPLSSTQLATFSVNQNLTSNWGLRVTDEGEDGVGAAASNADGALAVVAAAPNTTACQGGGGGAACNGGCDPTAIPGYSVTTANNLLGGITHNQVILTFVEAAGEAVGAPETITRLSTSGITEVPLNDNAGGDPNNLIYLQTQCGALVGNGTGGGICNCPTEG